MECKIFYSWQTDLPNATNRGFIESALENAVKSIRNDESIKVEPVVDRDTIGIPGSPDIANTIFEKIRQSQIFVADVSIINNGDTSRKTPNPNVLIELGYAMKTLGLDKIIMVMNTVYGDPETLPFDLRMRRTATYSLLPEDSEKAPERKKLNSIFEQSIRTILDKLEEDSKETIKPSTTPLEKAIQSVTMSQPDQTLLIRNYMKSLNNELAVCAPQFPGVEETSRADEVVIQALDKTIENLVGYSNLSEIISTMNSKESATALVKCFEEILSAYSPPTGFSGSYKNNREDYFKFIGHEMFVIFISFLIREGRWEIIANILNVHYYIKSPYRNPESVSFETISEYVKSLDYRNKNIKTDHAALLNNRHTEGHLSEVCPMEQFIAADFFLYLRSGIEWRAWSSYFLYQHIPRFIIDASRKNYAEQLLKPLNVNDIEDLRSLLRERTSKVNELYGNRGGMMRSLINYFELINNIGSK